MKPLDRMVRDIENLKKAQRALATGPQLANSSLENGTLDVNDADGNLRMMVGLQEDGRQTVTVVGGPTPPRPSAPQVTVDNGTIVARWDGTFVDELVAPTDWARTEIHVVQGSLPFLPSPSSARDSVVSAAGGEVTIGVERGQYTVCLVSWSQSGKLSAASEFVTVDVPGYGDIVLQKIDAAKTQIENAAKILLDAETTLGDKLDTADSDLANLKTSLGELADTTLPKLREDLTAAEGRLDDAEQDLAAVPGAISGAVQSAADAAARFDAELKSQMDQALANARTALEGDISTVRTRVDGKNSITQSVSSPPVQYAGVVGDRWEVMSTMGSGGLVLSSWRWNGNVWVSTILSSAVLAKIDIGTGTFGDLDGNRLRVGSVLADKLLVGSDRNMVPNGDLSKGDTLGWPREFSYQTTDTPPAYASAATINGIASVNWPTDLVAVQPGDTLIFEMWAKADRPNSRLSMWVYDQTGSSVGRSGNPWTSVQGGAATTGLPVSSYTVPTSWTKVVSQVTVPAGVTAARLSRTTPNVSSGSERDAVQSIAGVKLYRPVGGTLVEPGGIQTPHLAANVLEVSNLKAGLAAMAEAVVQKIAAATASIQQADIRNLFVTGQSTLSTVVAQTIAADVARFLKIEVGQLLAGTATMDQATVRKLFADVVVAGMAVATEFIGENAILTGAVTASKITASEELWAKLGEFVRIRTGMLEADAIDGMVITGATIQTARTGARVTQDASGIAVYDDADDWRVRLTPYGSTFKGDLEAESLVATGPAEFRNVENRLGQGARLILEAGVSDPTAPPVVQPYWASVGFTPPEGGVLYGLAYADGKYWTFVDVPNASEGDRLISIDPATGVVGDNIPITDQFWASGGVTAIGSELFLLGQKSGTPYKYFVRVYSTAGAFLREWEYTDVGWSKSNPLTYKPGIGTDGTNVVIAQCTDAGSLVWRTFNKTTGATLATVDCKDGTKSDIGGIYIGPGDWGGGTWVTVRKTTGTIGDAIVTFSTTGVWDQVKSWKTAENGRDTGLVFADGKFRTLNGGAGSINEYAPPTTGDDSPDWWAAYAWETDLGDDGSLDYDSRISPGTRFTWPRRSRLKVMGSPLPVGVGNIGGYTAKKATRPALSEYRRTFTHFRSDESVATWHYFDPAGMAATDANTYPRATPSSIASTTPMFEVRGDGSGKWGTLAFNPNGTVTGVPKVASGVVKLNVPSNNGRVSATVTLPAGRFTTKPAIQVTARTIWPVVHAATFIDETTTSFVVWARRDTAGPLDVAWTAIGE